MIGSTLNNKKIPTEAGIPSGVKTMENMVALKIAGPAVVAIEQTKLVKIKIPMDVTLMGT